MSYQPVIPSTGYSGWLFLTRTRAAQQEGVNASPEIKRKTDYFRDTISQVARAEELISDRRLLEVALGAFGLDEDINNKFFLRKILEDGTLSPDALANKLSDKRYLQFAKAFGFGDFATPRTVLSDFSDEIIAAYQERQFEIAVGSQDETLRLALSLDRDLGAIARMNTTDNGRWFAVLGNKPLRTVFETALGLPESVGRLDIDRQLDIFKDRAKRLLGASDLREFADSDHLNDLTRRFLTQAQLSSGPVALSPASAALTLLQSSAI